MKINPINVAAYSATSFGTYGKVSAAERKWQLDYNNSAARDGYCESSEDAFLRQCDADEFSEVMAGYLSGREHEVLVKKFGFDGNGERSREQIAEELGVSVGIVKNREEKAINKLKEALLPYYA